MITSYIRGIVSAGSTVYKRTVTIDHTKCGSNDSSNFTVLVSINDSSLKTIANGGHVNNSNGYDIVFYSDSGYTSIMNWETEFYDGTNGILIAWVKVATVSHTSDTVFYMKYGDSSISTFQGGSLGSAWDSHFKLVHHYPNGTTLSALDSTSNGNDATSTPGCTAIAGKIDGGVEVSQSIAGDGVNIASKNLFSMTGSSAVSTVACWFRTSSVGAIPVIWDLQTGTSLGAFIEISSGGVGYWWGYGGTFRTVNTTATISSNAWYYLVVEKTATGNNGNLYHNGVLQSSSTGSFGNPSNSGGSIIGSYHTGTINVTVDVDEFTISDIARGADWTLTNYNNQSSPGNIGSASFLTYGSETT